MGGKLEGFFSKEYLEENDCNRPNTWIGELFDGETTLIFRRKIKIGFVIMQQLRKFLKFQRLIRNPVFNFDIILIIRLNTFVIEENVIGQKNRRKG